MAQNFSNHVFSPSLTNLTDESDRILRCTIETLIALRLEEIDERWVQEIWDSQVSFENSLRIFLRTILKYSKMEKYYCLNIMRNI